MRRAAKRDESEPAIVEVLEAAGWHVHRCSDEGLPDLYVTRPDPGPRRHWLEVKTAGGTLRPAQARLWDAWEAMGTYVYVLESVDDARRWCSGSWGGHDWRRYRVASEGRGAKKFKPKSWVPARLRKRPQPSSAKGNSR